MPGPSSSLAPARAPRSILIGLALIALATLMSEVALTRIFSVTMWYHFAFVAISLAMFGMTAGALLVYLFARRFPPEATRSRMAQAALGFAATTVAALLVHLNLPFRPAGGVVFFLVATAQLTALAVPFVCSGICVCLALTRFVRSVGALYAADLAGAALGCLVLLVLLAWVDGPTAVLVIALLGAAASFVLAAAGSRLRHASVLTAVALLGLVVVNRVTGARGQAWIRPVWVKGAREEPAYTRWNSFSRIRVYGDPEQATRPFGWGLSPISPKQTRIRQLAMNIDAHAGTVLTHFDGQLGPLDYLRYDVVNVAHHLRRDADVLVIGVGGGRDILSALCFHQPSVTGVELNGAILETVNQRYGDFTGHLDRVEGVRFVEDEARSWLARQQQHFGIIQISLIDTWAATAAGAFALSENSLYTIEALQIDLRHLVPDGLLSISRWYYPGNPGETQRLAVLAGAALRAAGVENPTAHVILVGSGRIATLLVRPTPFDDATLERFESLCASLRFKILASPHHTEDPSLAALVSGEDLESRLAELPLDVSPPTDERPFFFHMLKARDVLRGRLTRQGETQFNVTAVFVLCVLLGVLLILTLAGIVLPLVVARPRPRLRGHGALLTYFLAIGLGFMIVEVAQMQRLTIFLGHPVYGLAVVLFSLLLASGAGSWMTQALPENSPPRRPVLLLGVNLLVVLACGLLTPGLIRQFQGAATAGRLLMAVALTVPMGITMGWAFPLGLRLAHRRCPDLTPWLWGINGAASVLASALALAVAIFFGITRALELGVAAYAIALLTYLLAVRSPALRSAP